MTMLLQVRRHPAAHNAETDEPDLAQNEKITGSVDCFGRFRGIHSDRKHFVARSESAPKKIQDAAVVQALEQVIPRKQSLSVLQRRVLQAGLQLGAGVTRRQ